jgi:hypothetical protein
VPCAFTCAWPPEPWRNLVSIKHLLRTLIICLPLALGSLAGVAMKPEEIEELMRSLNQQKITVTIPGESENGDGTPPV